jgi:hypothetical protein
MTFSTTLNYNMLHLDDPSDDLHPDDPSPDIDSSLLAIRRK